MGLALDALRATGAKLRKNFVDVFIEVMFLFVSVRKVNFTQMGKYGRHCEQTYRNNFTKEVDWVAYNTDLTRKVFSDPSDLLAIAVDQSHITKSGKCTWGVGRFWSGCDQSVMPGLEITGIGAVNATRRECMALRAVQTPGKRWLAENLGKGGKKADLHDWYIKVVKDYASQLQAITDILVADALYSTEKIVTAMVLLGFVMVSRLRKDTVLRYVYTGPRTGKRGAPRKYDGKIDPMNPDLGRMERVDALCGEEEGEYYTLVANVKCLKRDVRLVIWYPKGLAGVSEKGGGYKLSSPPTLRWMPGNAWRFIKAGSNSSSSSETEISSPGWRTARQGARKNSTLPSMHPSPPSTRQKQPSWKWEKTSPLGNTRHSCTAL